MSEEDARAQYVQIIEGMGEPVVEGTGLEITTEKGTFSEFWSVYFCLSCVTYSDSLP